jgi:hypothetical protein
MTDFHRKAVQPLTPEMKLRLLRAILASMATGGIIYLVGMHVTLPAVWHD